MSVSLGSNLLTVSALVSGGAIVVEDVSVSLGSNLLAVSALVSGGAILVEDVSFGCFSLDFTVFALVSGSTIAVVFIGVSLGSGDNHGGAEGAEDLGGAIAVVLIRHVSLCALYDHSAAICADDIIGAIDLGTLSRGVGIGIVGYIKFGNSDPLAVGLVCGGSGVLSDKLHKLDSLLCEAEGLLVAVCLESLALGYQRPILSIGCLDVQAGLGYLATVGVRTGSEGEGVNGVILAEINFGSDGAALVQVAGGGVAPIGVPAGGGVAVQCQSNGAFVSGIAAGGLAGCGGGPMTLAVGVNLVQSLLLERVNFPLGVAVIDVAPTGYDSTGIAKVIQVLTVFTDGPIGAIELQRDQNLILDHTGAAGCNSQVLVICILNQETAVNGSNGPDVICGDCILSGCKTQTDGAAAANRGIGFVVVHQLAGGLVEEYVLCTAYDFGNGGLVGDDNDSIAVIDDFRMGMTHGHQTDDHDQRQQKAKESLSLVFHFFLPFIFVPRIVCRHGLFPPEWGQRLRKSAAF